ncbi:MAG: hypothetical protein M3229_03085, partial [Actinomycetota bacterium]|nr:hypothetical protein [Actinomycetota bacterium]
VGDGDFPPLKTLYQTNLPTPPNPLVGRKKELVEVVRLLTRGRARVVTLTGPGGTGKTRFAVAAAEESVEAFADGVWFVDLSPVRDPALVLSTIAAALGARVDLAEHIGDRAQLLVLDNLEQVVDAASELGELVASCARLQLLCTSREPLRIGVEREYRLRPLPESPAVELFRQRADAVSPGTEVAYELGAQICDRVDRLPLAIELAAARVKVLEPAALLERLERRLPVLASRSRDLPERQRTLHSTIAWSYELLPPEEQTLFPRLAVFSGGATLDAVEEVCEGDLDVLEALVDKSLLRRREDRFVMLETVREYAVERLDESDDDQVVRHRHARFFLALAESTNLIADSDGEQRLDLAVAEVDNLRAAIGWAADANHVELALRIAVALEVFWVLANPSEGARWFEKLLAAPGEIPARLRAGALRARGGAEYIFGRYETGLRLYEESLAEYRRLGEERWIGHMLLRLAVEANRVGDRDRARALAEESQALALRTGSRKNESQPLTLLGRMAFADGDHERGLELLREGISRAADSGFVWWQSNSLATLAECLLELDRFEEAGAAASEALMLGRGLHDRATTVDALGLLAVVAARSGEGELAGRLWGAIESEETRGRIGQWEDYRDELAAQLPEPADEAFERGRAAGRSLSLDEAVKEALSHV